MKGGPLLKKIIYSSWFLALLPAVLIMTLIHPIGSRYKLEIESADKKWSRPIYADLNSDSISEMIIEWKGIGFSVVMTGSSIFVFNGNITI